MYDILSSTTQIFVASDQSWFKSLSQALESPLQMGLKKWLAPKSRETSRLSGSQMRSGPRSGDLLPMLGLPSCNVGFRESALAINKSIFTGKYFLTDLVYFIDIRDLTLNSSSLYKKFHTYSVTWPLRQIQAGSGRRRKCYLVLHLTVLVPS